MDTPCTIWPLSVGSHGYAQKGRNRPISGRRMFLVHRMVWMFVHGHIPAGMTVDHRCRVQRCINVLHLQLLSNEDNGRQNRQAQRGKGRRSYMEAGS